MKLLLLNQPIPLLKMIFYKNLFTKSFSLKSSVVLQADPPQAKTNLSMFLFLALLTAKIPFLKFMINF